MLSNLSFTSALKNTDLMSNQYREKPLSYCSCQHRWQRYNHSCYGRYNIQKPIQLAKATAKRHCEFIAGRYCAIQAIRRLQRSPWGNRRQQIGLYPDRSPLWPKGIIGSISHSKDRAMAVVGSIQSYAGLGIDCESLLTDSVARDIGDLILTPLEQELLLKRVMEYGFMVTLAFSAKESLFKALSPSVSPINSFHDFSIASISASKLILQPTKRFNDHGCQATAFSIDYIKLSRDVITMATITRPDS